MFSFVLSEWNKEDKVFMHNNWINNQRLVLGVSKFIHKRNYFRKFHKSDIKQLKCKYNGNLLNFILYNHSWPYVEKFKKDRKVDDCSNFVVNHTFYQYKWENVSGIYKITYLLNHLFTYYGSSLNTGERIKYHYYNGGKQNNFLGLFISTFYGSYFSLTLIEKCNKKNLQSREDWYLNKFKPLLNFLTYLYVDSARKQIMLILTKKN